MAGFATVVVSDAERRVRDCARVRSMRPCCADVMVAVQDKLLGYLWAENVEFRDRRMDKEDIRPAWHESDGSCEQAGRRRRRRAEKRWQDAYTQHNNAGDT